MKRLPSILFVCIENSCRSQMAEAFARRHGAGKVWPHILAGVALGAGIHGYVPQDFMAAFMGKSVWWAVPAAVLLGVPMYSNAAGILLVGFVFNAVF